MLCPLWHRWCGCSAGPSRGAPGSLQCPCVAESTAVRARASSGLAANSLLQTASQHRSLACRQGRSTESLGLEMSLALLHPPFHTRLLFQVVPFPFLHPASSPAPPTLIMLTHLCPSDGFSCQLPNKMTQTIVHPIRTALSREKQAG